MPWERSLVRIVYEPGRRFGGPFKRAADSPQKPSPRTMQRGTRGFYDSWDVPHLGNSSASIPVWRSSFLSVSRADYSEFVFVDCLVRLATARYGFFEGLRSSGVQEFRSSGVQEFRSSGVQAVEEFRLWRSTKLQEESVLYPLVLP